MYNTTWKEVFEKDEETRHFWEVTYKQRTSIDLMLQSFFMIKVQQEDFRVSELFKEYQVFIQKKGILDNQEEKKKFINELIEYAMCYKENVDPEKLNCTVTDYIGRMNVLFFKLDITTLIPYFVYLLKNVPQQADREAICKILESYFIRRIVCGNSTRNYNKLAILLIKKGIKTPAELETFLNDKQKTEETFPNDQQLEDKFPDQKLTNTEATGLLYLLELAIREGQMYQTQLRGIKYFDLEHIMPKKWETNWPINESDATEKQRLSDERNNLIKTLGNMTILTGSLNRAIKNADWNTKKDGNGRRKGLKEYALGLSTFTQYLDRDEWNEDTIRERATWLLEQAKKVWPMIKRN